ncbi:unnamed protein product [Durusdinium trenchii]|uniref:Uncharacterized protein n=2 Tax=Durusdinium trenchii TaxID=1381693 RepID=A0ABP0HK07_9DINO
MEQLEQLTMLQLPPWLWRRSAVLAPLVLVLRLLDAEAQGGSRVGWSLVNALGRLCGQINLTHLFVLQLHRGFAAGNNGISRDDIELPASASEFLKLVAGIFMCSTVIAAVLFVFLEAPAQALLARRRLITAHSNGTSNGVANGHRR